MRNNYGNLKNLLWSTTAHVLAESIEAEEVGFFDETAPKLFHQPRLRPLEQPIFRYRNSNSFGLFKSALDAFRSKFLCFWIFRRSGIAACCFCFWCYIKLASYRTHPLLNWNNKWINIAKYSPHFPQQIPICNECL